jgi:hypothetical protein
MHFLLQLALLQSISSISSSLLSSLHFHHSKYRFFGLGFSMFVHIPIFFISAELWQKSQGNVLVITTIKMACTVTQSCFLKKCNTFYTLTQALPFKILVQILNYTTKGSHNLLRPCQSLSRIAFMSWPFLTVYKGLESKYDFKTRCLPLLHPLFNNLVVSDEFSRALTACVPRTSAGVLCNPAMV